MRLTRPRPGTTATESDAAETVAETAAGPAPEPADGPVGREESDAAAAPRPAMRAAGARWGWLVPGLVAVLVVAGVLLLGRGVQLRGEGDVGNVALTDTAATQQVLVEVSTILATVFSYSPDTADRTEQAAAELLAGQAAEEYQKLFGQVRGQVTEQQLTLSTEVVRAGVVELTEDTAQVLVFLDQTTTRDGRPESATAAAQLSVTAELHDGRWLITAITAR